MISARKINECLKGKLLAEGKNRKTIGHEILFGDVLRFGHRSTMNLAALIQWEIYPGATPARTDQRIGLRLGSAFSILEDLLTLTISGTYLKQASDNPLYEYSRYTLGGGFVLSI